MSPEPHLRTVYHLPSFQGGDVAHPLCTKLKFGWAGPENSAWILTDDPEAVRCPLCIWAMRKRARAAA